MTQPIPAYEQVRLGSNGNILVDVAHLTGRGFARLEQLAKTHPNAQHRVMLAGLRKPEHYDDCYHRGTWTADGLYVITWFDERASETVPLASSCQDTIVVTPALRGRRTRRSIDQLLAKSGGMFSLGLVGDGPTCWYATRQRQVADNPVARTILERVAASCAHIDAIVAGPAIMAALSGQYAAIESDEPGRFLLRSVMRQHVLPDPLSGGKNPAEILLVGPAAVEAVVGGEPQAADEIRYLYHDHTESDFVVDDLDGPALDLYRNLRRSGCIIPKARNAAKLLVA